MSFKLCLMYSAFALIATIINILSQYISESLYPNLFISLVVGTIAGLYTKYFLDKTYIFNYQTNNAKEDSKTFMLYSTMGIFTTLVYLGFELGFEYMFDSLWMRYTGASIGLLIGYTIKYQLDKRFVFINKG